MLYIANHLPFHIQRCLDEDHRVALCHTLETYRLRFSQGVIIGVAAESLHGDTVDLDICQLACRVDSRLLQVDGVGTLCAIFSGHEEYTIVHLYRLAVHLLDKTDVWHLVRDDGIFLLCRVKGDTRSLNISQFDIVGEVSYEAHGIGSCIAVLWRNNDSQGRIRIAGGDGLQAATCYRLYIRQMLGARCQVYLVSHLIGVKGCDSRTIDEQVVQLILTIQRTTELQCVIGARAILGIVGDGGHACAKAVRLGLCTPYYELCLVGYFAREG